MVAYSALFEPAEEGGFVVTFPDFGYGVTQGETEQEATGMAADLLACLLSDCISKGEELPIPKVHRGRKYRNISRRRWQLQRRNCTARFSHRESARRNWRVVSVRRRGILS